MTLQLSAKPDADECLQRMEAWWRRENHDRPLLTIGVAPKGEAPTRKEYETERERWMDFDGRVDHALACLDLHHYVAETFPCFEPNLGPDILSTLWGLDLQFEPDTSWGHPILESAAQILDLEADFQALLWQEVERLTRMGLEAGEGKWITLYTDLHPNADVLSALLGPQQACIEFADDVDVCRRAVEHVTPACIEAYRRQVAMIQGAGLPVGSWMRAFSWSPTLIPSCDFSAMVGPEMFEEAILPSIREEMAAAERSIYHLDGPDALRHLDALLACPEIDAIQWVYGAGKGPARKWEWVYKKCLEAGKGVRVEAETMDDLLALHPVLGREGVWYCLHQWVDSLEEAERVVEFLSR